MLLPLRVSFRLFGERSKTRTEIHSRGTYLGGEASRRRRIGSLFRLASYTRTRSSVVSFQFAVDWRPW